MQDYVQKGCEEKIKANLKTKKFANVLNVWRSNYGFAMKCGWQFMRRLDLRDFLERKFGSLFSLFYMKK